MALAPIRLPRLPQDVQFTDPKTGNPSVKGMLWWQRAMEQIEAGVNGVIAAQAAAEAAQTAADTAQTAAVTAQAAADAAQDAVDAIVVPPSETRTVTANTTVTQNDAIILVDASAGAVTVTLLGAALALRDYTVKKIDASANTVDVEPDTGEDLNGGPGAITLTTQYESRVFVSDGTEWYA